MDTAADFTVPENLPFLGRLSCFGREWRDLAPLAMLRRYEAGWRYLGVLGELSEEE